MSYQPISQKTITRNASLLTFRMLLAMVVGLFTSRIVLQALGVENYGIYGLVGGIVTLVGFLQNSLTGGSSRFFAFELGRGNHERLQTVFSTSVSVHLLIGGAILVAGELIGLPFVRYCLNIPPDRLTAGLWVYQFSLVSVALTITQVPFIGLIQARERLHIYAIAEICNVTMRLGIAYLLLIADCDRLILYGLLNCLVSVVLLSVYHSLSMKGSGLRLSLGFDRPIAKEMAKFNGLDLFASFSATGATQGMNILINLFFGVICNAAVNLSTVVNGAVVGLATTSFQAFRPQIIKQYSAGNITAMQKLMETGLQFTTGALLCVMVPCMIEAHYVLQLWLGEVPPYAPEFLRVILMLGFCTTLSYQLGTPVSATGHLKMFSIPNGVMLIISLGAAAAVLHAGAQPWSTFIVLAAAYILCATNAILNIRRLIPEFRVRNILTNTAAMILTAILAACVVITVNAAVGEEGFLRLISSTLLFLIIFILVSWFTVLSGSTKNYLKSFLKNAFG